MLPTTSHPAVPQLASSLAAQDQIHTLREADWQEATRDAADWLSRFLLP